MCPRNPSCFPPLPSPSYFCSFKINLLPADKKRCLSSFPIPSPVLSNLASYCILKKEGHPLNIPTQLWDVSLCRTWTVSECSWKRGGVADTLHLQPLRTHLPQIVLMLLCTTQSAVTPGSSSAARRPLRHTSFDHAITLRCNCGLRRPSSLTAGQGPTPAARTASANSRHPVKSG